MPVSPLRFKRVAISGFGPIGDPDDWASSAAACAAGWRLMAWMARARPVLADELAAALSAQAQNVIRASVDGFHQPRALRYLQGKDSPLGFFEDSYDYPRLRANLLDPLSPGGNGRYRTAVFDHSQDQALDLPWLQAFRALFCSWMGFFCTDRIRQLLGIFAVFGSAVCGFGGTSGPLRDGSDPNPEAPSQRRYVQGQQIYLQRCEPWRWARVVLDNSEKNL